MVKLEKLVELIFRVLHFIDKIVGETILIKIYLLHFKNHLFVLNLVNERYLIQLYQDGRLWATEWIRVFKSIFG